MTGPKTPPGGGPFAADPGALGDPAGRNPVARVEAALARIEAAEPAVQGWRLIDRDGAFRQAEYLAAEATRGRPLGALHGVPVAIKDVIDVDGWPTRAGSRSRENAPPATIDATVVARLRAAGAVILGKAHTTEFAFFEGPPPTRNPHDLSRTPGGSSAGPAAVVAAGMVPLALGTQTAGSVSRPAAYCGIAAFKPSTLAWPGFGVVPFAPSFDTVGLFGYRVADAVFGARALMPDFFADQAAAATGAAPARIAVLDDPIFAAASAAVLRNVDEVAARLQDAGSVVERRHAPEDLARIGELHLTIREYELGHAHRALLDVAEGDVTPALREAVARGAAILDAHYLAALVELSSRRRHFWQALAGIDALLLPAAPDIAPVGMATGDARFIVPLTALGGPIVSVPAGLDQGLPLGVMLAAAPGCDAALLTRAEQLAPAIETSR